MKELDKKDKGTFVRLSQHEMDMLKVIREKHSINASSLFRHMVASKYAELENKRGIG